MKQTASSSSIPGAENQTKFMLIFMTVFIGFASLSLPTAIALYWIVTYAFMIVQTYLIKFIKNGKTDKQIKKQKKSINEKLKVKENLKYGKNK